MKLDHFNRKVMTNGDNATKFGAELNPAMVAVISDSLYQHKIPAVIREIACNCNDSHIEAGKEDVPFVVKLPNMFDPNITFQDFGVGLDDEGVRTVFAWFFKSTKNDSTKTTGGYGIGAKSILSYSDTFMVYARKDGVERHYAAFMGEDGMPAVELYDEFETTEGNGVSVKIPVKEEEFGRFEDECSVILSMFRTKPIIKGGTGGFEFLIDDIYEQIEEKGFFKIPRNGRSRFYDGDDRYALMNNVLYPLPNALFGDENIGGEYGAYKKSLGFHNNGVGLWFEDGELNPAASREYLQLKEAHHEKITQRIRDMLSGIKDETEAKLAECKTVYDAMNYIVETYGDYSLEHFKWKNHKKLSYYKNWVPNVPGMKYFKIATFSKHVQEDSLRWSPLRWSHDKGDSTPILIYRPVGSPETAWKPHVKKYLRSIGNNSGRVSCLVLPLETTPLRLYRLKNLLHRNFKSVITTDELKEIVKKQKAVSVSTYDRGEKKAESIYAKVIIGTQAQRVHHHVLDPNFRYATIDSARAEHGSFCPTGRLNKPTRYLVVNGNNSNKIAKLNLPTWKELLKQDILADLKRWDKMYFSSIFNSHRTNFRLRKYDDIAMYSQDTFWIREMWAAWKNNENDDMMLDQTTKYAVVEVFEEVFQYDCNEIEEELAELAKSYPLLERMNRGEETKQYIKMVDHCRNTGYNFQSNENEDEKYVSVI